MVFETEIPGNTAGLRMTPWGQQHVLFLTCGKRGGCTTMVEGTWLLSTFKVKFVSNYSILTVQ